LKAKQHGLSLASESGYTSPDTIELVILKANAIASNLANQLESKGFSSNQQP
jgi:large subunit ribosomal protein L10